MSVDRSQRDQKRSFAEQIAATFERMIAVVLDFAQRLCPRANEIDSAAYSIGVQI